MRTVVAGVGSLTGRRARVRAGNRAVVIGVVLDDVKGYIHRPIHIRLGRMHRVQARVSWRGCTSDC
jgi:hypothetical protein